MFHSMEQRRFTCYTENIGGRIWGKNNILNKSKCLMNKRIGKQNCVFLRHHIPNYYYTYDPKKIIPIPWENLRHQLLEKVIKKLVF